MTLTPRGLFRASFLALFACSPSDSRGSSGAALPAVRYDQHVAAGGMDPPAEALANPVAGQARVAAEGGKLFTAMNCDGCHGGGAVGFVGPSLVDGRWRYGGADGALFQSIYYGRPRGMPAYGGVLQPPGIWAIVTYLQAQPVAADIATRSW